jgi:hypothetical protein
MDVLRLYDPARRPPNWTEIVRPDQFVVFCSDAATGAATDADGRVTAPADASCLVFHTLPSARAFCEAQILRAPDLRFEIFDGRGRVEEPLIAVVGPARAVAMESSTRSIQRRTWAAVLLLACAGPLVWYDYGTSRGSLVLPTFLAVSMVLAALRLLFMNMIVRESERTRRARLKRYE